MARAKKEAALTPEERLQAALVPDWEWPYKLPENWCWTRIGMVSNFDRGITFPAAAKEAAPTEDNIPCLRTANVQENLEIDDMIYVNRDFMKGNIAKLVRENDIIMSSANSRELVGKSSLVTHIPFPMTFGGFVLNIRAKKMSSKYLFYFLRHEFLAGKFIGESSQTTNIANINTTTLGNYEIPLPPIPEQHRIVDRIESLFAKLDEAKEKAQAVVDSFETRKAAILHKAFTGELTAKWREEHNISKTTWGEKKWGDFLQSIEAGKNWSAEGRPPEGTEFGVVKVSAVTWGEFDELESKTCVVAEQWNSKTQIHKGDFLFSRANTLQLVGNCVIVRNISKRLMLSDKILRFKFDEIAHPRFVLYFTRSRIYRGQVEQLASGNQDGMRNISQKNLKLVFFPIPTVVEQIEIISILDRAFAKEQQAKEAAEAVLDQIDLMKKSILARAFRGELGTNDPSEESAVKLLKKVLHTSAEPKSKTKRKFIPPKIEALIKTDLERKIIMAFIQSDTAIMPIQQLMSVSSRKFDVIETLRNLQERGILLKENDTYRLMG